MNHNYSYTYFVTPKFNLAKNINSKTALWNHCFCVYLWVNNLKERKPRIKLIKSDSIGGIVTVHITKSPWIKKLIIWVNEAVANIKPAIFNTFINLSYSITSALTNLKYSEIM